MNKTLILAIAAFLFLVLPLNLWAQPNNEAKTLFGNNGLFINDIGFMIAPSYGRTQIDKSTASLFQLRGGAVLKDKFSLGAFFNTSINQIKPKSETIQNIYMAYWTVGFFTEYTLLSKKILHLTFPLHVGFGEVEMDSEYGNPGLGEANFTQIEPAALVEVNLFKHLRLNLGAGYRFVSQMNYRNLNQSDISGLTGYVGLKLGLFR